MAGTFTQVAPDGEGDKIAGQSVTRGADEVVRQEVIVAGKGVDAEIAAVLSETPLPENYGLVVRPLEEDSIVTGTITTTDLVLGPPSASGLLLTGESTEGSYVAIKCVGGSSSWQVLVRDFNSGNLYFEKSLNSTNGVDGNWGGITGRMEGFNIGVFVQRAANQNGQYAGNTAGPAWFRVRAAGALSGTPSVTIVISKGLSGLSINSAIPIGTNNIGRVTLADAASTAAVVSVKNTAAVGNEYGLVVRPILSDGLANGTIAAADLVLGTHPTTGIPLSGTPTAGSYVFLAVPIGQSVLDIEVGSMGSGTLLFEKSLSSTNGVDGLWVPLYLRKEGSSDRSQVLSTTAVGVYRGAAAGYKYVRVRGSIDFSGSSQITIVTSSGTGVVTLGEALPPGTNSIGNVGIASGNVGVSSLPALSAGTNNIGDVDVASLPALPAGNNNIGDVDIATLPSLPPGGNNIGDVDVLTLPALPAGNNNIGDVDVLTLPALPAGTNNIGDVDVLTLPPLPAGTNIIGTVRQHIHGSRIVNNLFMATMVAATTAEVLMSLTGYRNGAAVAATTTPAVVPAGRILRITSIVLEYKGIATLTGGMFRLRANPAGVVVLGGTPSPLVDNWTLGQVLATAGAQNTSTVTIFPEGLEFPAGYGIGVGYIGLSTAGAPGTAAGFGRISINGYDYAA